jgi:hypothetical protein
MQPCQSLAYSVRSTAHVGLNADGENSQME